METSLHDKEAAPVYSFACKYVSSSHVGFKPMAISVRLTEVCHTAQKKDHQEKKKKKEKRVPDDKKDCFRRQEKNKTFKRVHTEDSQFTLPTTAIGHSTLGFLPAEEVIREEEENWDTVA